MTTLGSHDRTAWTPRPPVSAALTIIALSAAPIIAAQAPAGGADTRPTVALAEFTNGALGRTAEFAELSTGIQDIMITTLAPSPNVRVVERRKLQNILDEQKLASSSEIDQSTAIRVGRILGAQHFVAGGAIIFRGDVRIDVRAFNTETSRVEYTETIQGKESELLELIDRLSRKVALRSQAAIRSHSNHHPQNRRRRIRRRQWRCSGAR